MDLHNSCNNLPNPALFLKEKFFIPPHMSKCKVDNIWYQDYKHILQINTTPWQKSSKTVRSESDSAYQGKESLSYSPTKMNEQTFKLWQTEWQYLIWVRLFSHQLHLFTPS